MIHAALLVAVVVYFLSYLTAAPNSAEGAVMIDYVHRTSNGERVFFDFFDYYGPINWWVPSRFYLLAGQKEIGVRVYLVILKVVTVVAAYALVRRLADVLYALLAAVVVAALVGQPWTFFQIPYAPHLTLPFILVAWLLVLPPLGERPSLRIAGAALATATTLWIKVSAGAFLFVGVAFYFLYWLPAGAGSRARSPRGGSTIETSFRLAELAGLGALLIVFHAFMWKHVSVFYLVSSSLPLVVVCAWTSREVIERWRTGEPIAPRVRAASAYAASTVALWAAFLLAYFGRSSRPYLVEQFRTFQRLRLETPFSTLGMEGEHHGFARWHWAELPWLVTVAGVGWLFLRFGRVGNGTAKPAPAADATIAGLWAMSSIHSFVTYPRSDDSHLVQAVVPAAPVLFVLLFHLEGWLSSSRALSFARRALVGAAVLYASTIITLPPRSAFAMTFGDWKSPRLRYLTYHSHGNSDLGDGVFAGKSYAEWDSDLDQAAQTIDSLAGDGEEVLVLGRAQILNYASNTKPFGGRYSHFFHLARYRLLDAKGFRELVPADAMARLTRTPPRLFVLDGDSTLVEAVPEIGASLARGRYLMVGRSGPIRVYQRQ
jgi:hypothetical protein